MRTQTIAIGLGTVLVLSVSASVWVAAAPLSGQPVSTVRITPINTPVGTGKDDNPPTNQSGGSTNTTNNQTGSSNGIVSPPVRLAPLKGKPLDVCKGRQKSINLILARVVKRGTNQMNFFSSVATKVEGYVTTNNLTVPNYSTLVATINSDQATVQSDITALKANDTFNCDGTNPTSTASTIKSELKQEITDLQTYRKDVKSLIVAVIAVVKSSQSSSSSSGGNQ